MQSAFLRTTDRKAVLDHIFFNGWAGPARTAIVGVMAYAMLIVFLRLSGKRTLSKMNAFDFIVTVALGSVLATILLSKDVTVLQGGVALALLIVLQYAVTWTSVRIGWVRKLVTGEPTLLLFEGQLLAEAMRRTRVTEDEVSTAVRAAGLRDYSAVHAVVLETDASFSVIEDVRGRTSEYASGAGSSLRNLARPR